MELPRIEFTIDDMNPISGVKTMSLVDAPAIESDFVYFSKQKPKYVALQAEGYKQVVAGLALIPDKDILRYDLEGRPYNGYFSKDTVEKIRNKFHKEQMTSNVNTDHSSTHYIDAYLIESFIIDSEEMLNAVKAKGIKEATVGSWYVQYKIEDKATFERVVSGELNGFSVEIFLNNFSKVNRNNLIENEESLMSKFLDKFKALLIELEKDEAAPAQPEEKKLENAKDADGKTIEYGAIGEAVTVDGQPAPDGDITLDNGKVLSIASGVLTEIKDAPAPEAQKKEEPKAEPNAELEKAKADLEAANKDKENLSKEIVSLKAEVEKLKKAPAVKPTVKVEKKEEQVDFSKLSNADRLRHKYNIK